MDGEGEAQEEHRMIPLKARDVMTPDVVTVPPATPVMVVARLLAERGISAVPVVEGDGKLRGIVTEADLIRRLAGEEDRPLSWFGSLFADQAAMADRYARTHGVTAEEIMTEEVLTVDPEMGVSQVAHLMEDKGVRRVVVTREGRLAGIVSRADLLRAIVAPPSEAGDLPDERIRRAIQAAMKKEPWADTFYTFVEVKDGIVEFHGFSRSEAVSRALRVLAEQVPGVKGVKDETQPMPAYLYAGV
jgi:CBS domain-containing protein